MGAQAVRLSNVDIDNALKNKDFEVLFQPIFDLSNGALARMETFVRWRHPSLGVLPPGAFISFFETQGRMSELTRYVLAEALNAYLDWRGPYAPGFSINLALSDLSDDALAPHLVKLLRDKDFPPDLVTLECLMPPMDMDLEMAAAHFKRLASTGVRLAIEVRGRANDFLRTIDPFPFEEIKTGGSAILRFARTVRGPGLSAISDLLDIANKANAVIVAVGVEDQASLAALRGLGFTAAQGNHLAKVGKLNEFLPGRVNDVRALLGLDALDAESLSALFRTETPLPQASVSTTEKTAAPETRAAAPADRGTEARVSGPETAAPADADKVDEAKKAKAREKAKALALAKRAKAREARKAAAIKRAKAKAAQSQQAASHAAGAAQSAFAPSQAPRELQDRLNKEFADNTAFSKAPADGAPEDERANAAADRQEAADETAAQISEEVAAASDPRAAEQPQMASTAENADPVAAADDAEELSRISLSVGTARAYFQPGVRVGRPALRQDPPPNAPAPDAPLADAPIADPPVSNPEPPLQAEETANAPRTPEMEQTPAAPEPPQADATLAAPSPASRNAPKDAQDAGNDIIQGDLHRAFDEDEREPAAPLRKSRQKSFLTRTVVPWPTHFWPKSWKRWRRRMKARRIARLRAAETAQASDLA